MKIVGLREQDLEDLELLLPEMSEQDKETLKAIWMVFAGGIICAASCAIYD